MPEKSLSFIQAVLIAGLLAAGGCSREWYRRQADDEVQSTLQEKHGWLDHGGIDPVPQSRLFDSFSRDHPPLPPDDPESHRLMHEVDGHAGFENWHRYGDADTVDDGHWLESLPRDQAGEIVLDVRNAVGVARTHSREYQQELEDLYLSALDVTFERFRFDAQFFAGNTTAFGVNGRDRGGTSALTTTTDLEARRLTATGGELVAGLANSIIWQFSGGQTELVGSTASFSLIQPLLRFGGRARVLERLTQTERTLLANVRQMEQFRQGFYVEVMTGRNSGEGPSAGGAVGASGLGLLAGSPGGRAGAADAAGFLGLLQDQQQIRNQEANVAALRDSLAQLEAAFDFGRLPNRLQVDQARQALYNSQSSLLSSNAAYQTSQEGFAISIGLPPTLPLKVQDRLLERFTLIDPAITKLQDEVGLVLNVLRSRTSPPDKAALKLNLDELLQRRERIESRIMLAGLSLEQLRDYYPERVKQLGLIRSRVEIQQDDVDPRIYDAELLEQRIVRLEERFPKLRLQFETLWKELQLVRDSLDETAVDDARKRATVQATELSGLLLELALTQAEARLETVSLIPIELRWEDALTLASNNRLDWMNARARLVDSWRQIEFNANLLQSDLDLVVSGDIGTRGDNPVDFRAENSRLRFGLEFDSPVTRLAERNQYRETLINYQRARRDYMLFEDRLTQSVRNTLRIAELSQLNFEVRRAAVRVAVGQVELARVRLNEPPRPGAASQFSPTTARDLVSALTDLLNSQNDFLNTWVNYEVIRVLLDFELGTMRLDEQGLWLDPGPILTPTSDEPPPEAPPAES